MKFKDYSTEIFGLIQSTVNSAVIKSVAAGKKHAQEVVPVRTGKLRDSIETEIRQTKDSLTGIVSADAGYALFVEFGTRKQDPQPFLEPAMKVASKVLMENVNVR